MCFPPGTSLGTTVATESLSPDGVTDDRVTFGMREGSTVGPTRTR